jgi:hypothetical protein
MNKPGKSTISFNTIGDSQLDALSGVFVLLESFPSLTRHEKLKLLEFASERYRPQSPDPLDDARWLNQTLT